MPVPAAPQSRAYWSDIERGITAATHATFTLERRSAAPGGCINTASAIEGSGSRCALPIGTGTCGSRASANMPRRKRGSELDRAGTHRACTAQPRHGCNTRRTTRAASSSHCRRLWLDARQHDRFYTSVEPLPSADWPAFWRDHRLGFQLTLACENGYGGKLQTEGERLLERVPTFFASYTPQPSLLHGDLWSGNAAADENGVPVIFDPALYYGDREADIAMTELFGGYSPAFYDAYGSAYPLNAGYTVRKNLYNLYHVLNHLNLFGGGYLRQAEQMIGSLLAHVS